MRFSTVRGAKRVGLRCPLRPLTPSGPFLIILNMNRDQESLVSTDAKVVLTADDISAEEVRNLTPAVIPTDRPEDDDNQKNEQNFQNN